VQECSSENRIHKNYTRIKNARGFFKKLFPRVCLIRVKPPLSCIFFPRAITQNSFLPVIACPYNQRLHFRMLLTIFLDLSGLMIIKAVETASEVAASEVSAQAARLPESGCAVRD
jgi:hypothetical protein